MKYEHKHDRDACADCARQRAKWGPADHCGRTCELQPGDKVRIRGGKAIWRVEHVYAAHVTVSSTRPRRPRERRTEWRTFGPGMRRWNPGRTRVIDDDVNSLIPVEGQPA